MGELGGRGVSPEARRSVIGKLSSKVGLQPGTEHPIVSKKFGASVGGNEIPLPFVPQAATDTPGDVPKSGAQAGEISEAGSFGPTARKDGSIELNKSGERRETTSVVRRAKEMGFTTVDISAETAILCNIFGTPLSEAPAAVIKDEAYKRVLALQRENQKEQDLVHLPDPDARSSYSPYDKIIFYEESDFLNPRHRAHEISHRVIDEINPGLLDYDEDWIKVTKAFYGGEKLPAEFDVERLLAKSIVHEGFATWAELKAVPLNSRQEESGYLFLGRNIHPGTEHQLLQDREWIEANFVSLQWGITVLKSLYQKPIYDTPTHDTNWIYEDIGYNIVIAQRLFEDPAVYSVGFYFAHGVEGYLKREGLTEPEISEMMVKVIQNPPQTLEGFKDPVAYAQQLYPSK